MSSLTLRPGKSLMLFLCIFVFMFIISGLLASFLLGRIADPAAAMRIATVIQDLLIFIVPPVATAVLSSRLPARWLSIERQPQPILLLGAIAILIVAMPWLNLVVELNKNITLPQFLSPLEEKMRMLEDSAQAATDLMLGGASVWSMLVSVLIVGVLAGLSEEIFFRGGLQRIMLSLKFNQNAAIWVTALIFSAFHFQFYGFLPRLLLGAYFGYLVYWTRCLWIPIVVHAFNNTLIVVSTWMTTNRMTEVDIDKVGIDLSRPSDLISVIIGGLLTIVGIYYYSRYAMKHSGRGESTPVQPKS